MQQGTRAVRGSAQGQRRGCGRQACDCPALLVSGSGLPHASQQSRTIERSGTGCWGCSRHEAEAFVALEVPVRAEEAGLERRSAPDSAHRDGA